MKSKKGLMFESVMFFAVLIILISALLVLYHKQNKFPDGYKIGERQFSIINAYQKAEFALFYTDQAAKYSLEQSIYDLAKNGGIVEFDAEDVHAFEEQDKYFSEPNCKKLQGYNVWYKVDREGKIMENCFDEKSLSSALEGTFDDKLNRYVLDYPEDMAVDNYVYKIEGNIEISGLAVTPIYFDILKKQGLAKKEEGIYLPGIDAPQPITTIPGIPVSSEYRLAAPVRPFGSIVDRVVLHHTGDDAASKTYNTLKNRKLSVHYIIDRDGKIYYAVDEARMAMHAKGWNSRSIGIEIVNTGRKSMEYTDMQYIAISSLLNDIASRWPTILVDDEHVIGHYQASTSGKWDPSPNFDWARVGLPEHSTLVALNKNPPDGYGYG